GLEEGAKNLVDAKDSEASGNAENSEYRDAEDSKDYANVEEAEEFTDTEETGVEGTEAFVDAEEVGKNVIADETEGFIDAGEEGSESEEDEGSVYEDHPDSADEDENVPQRNKKASKKVAQKPPSEDKVHETPVEPARDEREDSLSTNSQPLEEKYSDSKMASSARGSESERATPTCSTFTVVIESPTG